MATNLVCWNCGGPRAENSACTVCPAPPVPPSVGPELLLRSAVQLTPHPEGLTLGEVIEVLVKAVGVGGVLRAVSYWLFWSYRTDFIGLIKRHEDFDGRPVSTEAVEALGRLVSSWPMGDVALHNYFTARFSFK